MSGTGTATSGTVGGSAGGPGGAGGRGGAGGGHAGGEGSERRRARSVRASAGGLRLNALRRPVAWWLAAGLLVGLVWRLVTPWAAAGADNYERLVAGEIVLAVLEVLAGLVVAVLGLMRSGPGSAARLAAAVVGSGGASVVAWGVGRLLGASAVTMTAVLLLWPLTVAAVTVLVSLVATLVSRDAY